MKKLKKFTLKSFLKLILVLGIFGVLTVFLLNLMVINGSENNILTLNEAQSQEVDCILILGAGVNDQGFPSPILRDRLNKGIELYQANISNRLLMSGDHGNLNYDEVNVMKKYAIDQGIESSNIFMDHAGFSTYESMIRARDVFMVKKVLIVSQKEHLYRAIYIAEALGMQAIGVAAEDISYSGDSMRDIRETLARVKDVFTSLFKPKPTYLGNPISIQGDGDITND